MIFEPIPNPIPIACVVCLQPMRVEAQLSGYVSHDESVFLAVECACGRRLGRLSHYACIAHRNKPEHRYASTDLESLDPDELAAWGRELVELARERMAIGERCISAATWVRDGRRIAVPSPEINEP